MWLFPVPYRFKDSWNWHSHPPCSSPEVHLSSTLISALCTFFVPLLWISRICGVYPSQWSLFAVVIRALQFWGVSICWLESQRLGIRTQKDLVFIYLVSWDRVPLCGSGWPETLWGRAGLKLEVAPGFCLRSAGITMCATRSAEKELLQDPVFNLRFLAEETHTQNTELIAQGNSGLF